MESFAWRVAADVWATLSATWPFLVLSVLAAAALNVYVGTDRLSGWLRRRTPAAVVGAVALATLTPFCSCGTTAVTLGMLASHTPWAPIVAFMVASPLTSPSELVLSGGLLGWPFAWVFFGGTIVLGLVVGAVTAVIERTGWLRGQARMAAATGDEGCATSCDIDAPRAAALSLGPGAAAVTEVGTLRQRYRLDELGREVVTVGRKLAVFFLGFTALGYALIEAIPTAVLQTWLGGDGLGSVVVAAVLGIPAYVNTEGSLPLVAGLMDGGMGPGAAMAFLVTGAGTSVGAIGGMLVIARRRVVGLVVGSLVVGAVVLVWATQLVLG
jgi:uncharacterized membrane protein YraQ (UPF0718 family)